MVIYVLIIFTVFCNAPIYYCLLLQHAGGRGTRTFIKIQFFLNLNFKILKGGFHINQRNPPRSATEDQACCNGMVNSLCNTNAFSSATVRTTSTSTPTPIRHNIIYIKLIFW